MTDIQKQQFLLGNLIVDSIKSNININDSESLRKYRQEEKRMTHFRDKENIKECIQEPNIDTFIEKYLEIIRKDYTAFGYLFHLYVDKLFFKNLFNDTFICLDKNRYKTNNIDDLFFIKVKKNGKVYNIRDFWSYDSNIGIYHDYTVINKILIEKYGISFDKTKLLKNYEDFFINPGIDEVDYNNINSIVEEMTYFIKISHQLNSDVLYVFDEEKIQNFIEQVLKGFISIYLDISPIKTIVKELKKC